LPELLSWTVWALLQEEPRLDHEGNMEQSGEAEEARGPGGGRGGAQSKPACLPLWSSVGVTLSFSGEPACEAVSVWEGAAEAAYKK